MNPLVLPVLAALLLVVPATEAALILTEPSSDSPLGQMPDPATGHYAAGLEALRAGDLDAAEVAF